MLWKGKPLEQYSKEELIAIIKTLATTIELARKRHIAELEVMSGKN